MILYVQLHNTWLYIFCTLPCIIIVSITLSSVLRFIQLGSDDMLLYVVCTYVHQVCHSQPSTTFYDSSFSVSNVYCSWHSPLLFSTASHPALHHVLVSEAVPRQHCPPCVPVCTQETGPSLLPDRTCSFHAQLPHCSPQCEPLSSAHLS